MNIPAAIMTVRMGRLPRRHCIAHLCALIRQQPACSMRRRRLVALLRDQMDRPAEAGRVPARQRERRNRKFDTSTE